MKLFKLFASFCGIIALVFIVSLFFPRHYRFESSTDISTTPRAAFAYLGDLRNWEAWSAWNKSVDSTLTIFYGKRSDSLGGTQYFSGQLLGSGRFKISLYKPDSIVGYDLRMHEGQVTAHGYFRIVRGNGQVHLSWIDTGNVGYNPLFRFMIPSKKKSTEAAFADGLKKIKTNLEKQRSQDNATRSE